MIWKNKRSINSQRKLSSKMSSLLVKYHNASSQERLTQFQLTNSSQSILVNSKQIQSKRRLIEIVIAEIIIKLIHMNKNKQSKISMTQDQCLRGIRKVSHEESSVNLFTGILNLCWQTHSTPDSTKVKSKSTSRQSTLTLLSIETSTQWFRAKKNGIIDRSESLPPSYQTHLNLIQDTCLQRCLMTMIGFPGRNSMNILFNNARLNLYQRFPLPILNRLGSRNTKRCMNNRSIWNLTRKLATSVDVFLRQRQSLQMASTNFIRSKAISKGIMSIMSISRNLR